MANANAYTIIFTKLNEAHTVEDALTQHAEQNGAPIHVEATAEEIDEIAEMREIVLAVSEHSPVSFTTT